MRNKYLKTNEVYNMDVMDFLDRIPDSFIDLAIIDPPYNLKKGDWDKFKTTTEFLDFTYTYLEKCIKKIKKGGSLYIFNTAYNAAFIFNFLLELKMNYQIEELVIQSL